MGYWVVCLGTLGSMYGIVGSIAAAHLAVRSCTRRNPLRNILFFLLLSRTFHTEREAQYGHFFNQYRGLYSVCVGRYRMYSMPPSALRIHYAVSGTATRICARPNQMHATAFLAFSYLLPVRIADKLEQNVLDIAQIRPANDNLGVQKTQFRVRFWHAQIET
eukprot:236750-Rhodomonas_salina.2